MTVCFINPAPLSYVLERNDETTGSYPPLGMLYMISYLNAGGYKSVLIDQHATKESTQTVVEKVKKIDPLVIGFNTLTDVNMGKRAVHIARKIKEWNPNVPIVFGNCHATFNHDRILKKYGVVDACVRGEGEITFFEIVRALESGGGFDGIKGVTYRDGTRIKVNPDRPLIENIDELPIPDRSACGDVRYLQNYGGLNGDYGEFTSIQSSRGCTFNCTFCAVPRLSKGRWRPRSVSSIIEELHALESMGYTNLLWVDDNFTNSPKRSIALFKEMKRENFDFTWACDQHVATSSVALFRAMKAAGCKSIAFGVESANQRILDSLNKKITPTMSKAAIRKAKKDAGIDFVMGMFIVGLPTETMEEIRKTILFPRLLDLDFPQFHVFGAMPGTWIWDQLESERKINAEKYWENGVKVLEPPLEDVQAAIRRGYMSFVMRPTYIFRQVVATLTSKHRRRIMKENKNVFATKRGFMRFMDFIVNMWTHGDAVEDE
ncbi:MAG: B12-binding domain-containing radical SAM protein [Promethearchaeota archaeon]